MERELDDVNVKNLSSDEINEMEERRIDRLSQAGIDEKDVLDRSNKNLSYWNSYFNENIVRGKDDMNFALRDQWTAVERSEFTRLGKFAMIFNKIYDSTKKIIGEQRKNKPDLIVRSLTGKATQEQINLRADLVRTISYQSQNDLVYQTAFKSALMMSFGAFQVTLDYESPRSFNRVIRYDIIPDPTMCSWDPTAIKPHKGDGNNCSRRFVYSRDEFFATYPYVLNPVSYVDPNMMMDLQWSKKDIIIVCDEFVKEWFPLKIFLLKDSRGNKSVVTESEWKEREKRFENSKEYVKDSIVGNIIEREIPKIIEERQTQDYKIMNYRMLQNQIIDFSEWPSRYLPIPFVDGDSYYIEGKQYTKSFIHEARDAQKLFNYARSETASELKNRRREQWMGTPDNIEGYEQFWRNPEVVAGILLAKPDPKTGLMPQKMAAWEVSQGLFNTASSASQDIREILGFSENEALQGRDISGKARRERKIEGSMSAYVYFDNLNQAIEQGGRIVNDLLPYIIGEDERHMKIIKKDGKNDSIIVNERQGNGDNEVIKNRLEDGDYDVEIDTGPSFAVQKEVALEFFQQTIAANPQSFNLIADLWAKNLDVQYMPQISERFKTVVPPQILAKEEGKELPPQPPSPQEQMMKQEMMLKQSEMQEKQQSIQIKAKELELKREKLEIEKSELLLRAQKAKLESEMDIYNHQANIEQSKITHGLDHKKHHDQIGLEIAKILSDLHKHENSKRTS